VLLYWLQFDFLEIATVDALSFGDRDKSVVVDTVDNLHDVGLVGFVGHNDQHLLRLVGEATFTVEEGHSATDFAGDGVTNFLVAGREDHDLIGLLVAVKDHVEHIGHGDHDDVTVDDIGDFVGDEVGAADDEDIQVHDHLARRDVVELGEDEGDDVGAAAVAAHGEGEADAAAAESAADDGAHEGVKGHRALLEEKSLDMQTLLPQDEEERRHDDAINGVGAKLGAEHLEADDEEDAVDDEIQDTDGQRDAGGDIQDRRNTADATTDNFGRKHECRPGEGVDSDAEGDDDIRKNEFGFFLKDMHDDDNYAIC